MHHRHARSNGIGGFGEVHRAHAARPAGLNVPFAWPRRPRQHLHQRALASAVLANHSVDFARSELDGDVVGYGYLSTWRDKCAYETTMENTLYLRDDARGQGIGGPLLDELVRLGAEAGVREIIAVISASADAVPSIRLHEKAGFARVGEMPNVGRKFDEWLGVVMLQKSLA